MPSWSDQLVFLIWKAKQHPLSTALISAPSYPYHASALTQIKLDHHESLAVVHLKKHICLHHVIHNGHFFLLSFSFVCHHPFLLFPFQPSSLCFPSRLSGDTMSRDHGAMRWPTWGLLLMVTNDMLCRGEERKCTVQQREATIHAGGQCLCFMHR